MDLLLPNLPVELLLQISKYLETGDYVAFASTCRSVRLSLQGDNLNWLINRWHPEDNFFSLHATNRNKVIASSSRLVLSHVLINMVYLDGYNRHIVQPLLRAGASFRQAPCGKFLVDCLLNNHGNLGRLHFALKHGASMNDIEGGLGELLEETLDAYSSRGRALAIVQFASAEEKTWVIDQLIAKEKEYDRVKFLTSHGAVPSDKAQAIFAVRKKMRADRRLYPFSFTKRIITPSDVLEVLNNIFQYPAQRLEADLMLDYAIQLAQLSGGVGGLIEIALRTHGLKLATHIQTIASTSS